MTRFAPSAVAVVLTLAIAVPAVPQTVDRSSNADLARKYRDANIVIVRARDAFAKKNYDLARKEASAILAKLPEFAEANFMMAKLTYMEKDYPAALGYIEKAEATHLATLQLGQRMAGDRETSLRRRRDEQVGAVADLRGQLAVERDDQRRLILQTNIERGERIVADIDRILNDPAAATAGADAIPAEYAFIHGNIFLRMGRADDAATQYIEALKLDPGYANAANNLASLYYSAKQYDKALEVLQGVESRGIGVNPELKQAVLAAKGQ